MGKLVYVYGSEITPLCGVWKKIQSQLAAFNMHGIETEAIIVEERPKWRKILPFSSSFDWDHLEIGKPDYLYIRFEPVSYPFIRFLRRAKADNPYLKIILEIPTYPYIQELRSKSNPLTIARDCFYQRFLKKYLDRIVTIGVPGCLFGIQTVPVVNSISVDRIQPPERQNYRDDSVLNVVSVSTLEFYYGFDRMIRGLHDYYQTPHREEVHFHLVGRGRSQHELEELTRSLKMDSYVHFHGFKTGSELEEIYEMADVGIDCLGGHRKNILIFGTLKSREYLCKGLPFVTELDLPKELAPISKYILTVPATEESIDINEIVTFHHQMKKEGRKTIIEDMRNFAYEYCDVRIAMNPIIEYLKEV